MESLDDMGLLREYATSRSETAFQTLVDRRIGLVYSAALRQVGDPSLAEEVTQLVFIVLAQKAGSIPGQAALSGWLFNTTRFTALAQIRAATKRQRHEHEAQMGTETESAATEPLWKELSPVLDEALSALGETDRRAVLLRFFENKSLAEVAQALAVGEDGARKRVNRALERLHRYFRRRGISSTTALTAAAISAHSIQAAPAALAKSVTALAVAQGAAARVSTLALAKGAAKFMVWSKAQTAAVGLVVVGLAAVSVTQHASHARLRGENQSLAQQLETVRSDNDRLSNLLAQANSSPAPQAHPSDELLRLRGEVGLLRRQTNELATQLARASGSSSRRLVPAQAQPAAPLPEEYPKTARAATRGIFEALSRGDLDKFFTDFGEPGVPKEKYDKIFGDDRVKAYLTGLQVLSVGEPTNSFGPNMWFVPYAIRLADGTEKEFQMHIAQDPSSQRWYFKGGI